MKKQFIFFVSIVIISFTVNAQPRETDAVSKNEIIKLGFMVGKWQGSGWMMDRDGSKHHFQQQEDIQFKLDSTAILIEGLGKAEGKIIHNAMAIIAYNKTDSAYSFNSYLSSGLSGTYKAELHHNKLYWYLNENMRYVIEINKAGQWFEIGEMKRGESWFQFFEMTLDKR